jgi:hypothetical protein
MHIFNLNYVTENKIVNKALIDDNRILVVSRGENNYFKYSTGDSKNEIVVVHFKYGNDISRQGFYRNEKTKIWLPFDGIKANVDSYNRFGTYIDDSSFKENGEFSPFGCIELMVVSYLLGGGIWMKKNKYSDVLKTDPRINCLHNLYFENVSFSKMLYINHFIGTSVSCNYFGDRRKKINWSEKDKYFTAFDNSRKMKNSYQIEYTPPRFETEKEYLDFYELVENSEVEIKMEESNRYCCIL